MWCSLWTNVSKISFVLSNIGFLLFNRFWQLLFSIVWQHIKKICSLNKTPLNCLPASPFLFNVSRGSFFQSEAAQGQLRRAVWPSTYFQGDHTPVQTKVTCPWMCCDQMAANMVHRCCAVQCQEELLEGWKKPIWRSRVVVSGQLSWQIIGKIFIVQIIES